MKRERLAPGLPKRLTISAQDVDLPLWNLTQEFLKTHPNMRGRGDLVRTAIESYIALANKFGINADWHPMIPNVPVHIYKNYGKENDV